MSEDLADLETLVLVHGSGFSKVGFAGDDCPSTVFPTIVGRPKSPDATIGMGSDDTFVGEEAKSKQSLLHIKYPVEVGVTTDWDDMEKIWHHSFYNLLRVTPEEHAIVLTEPPLGPRLNREKMVHTMFELFNCAAVYVGNTAVLSLYSSGRTTGTVFQSGHGVTYTTPVVDGQFIPHASTRICLGGKDLTAYLTKLLGEIGYEFTTTAEYELISEIKEKLCFVAGDYDAQMNEAASSSAAPKSYELPDGNLITLDKERFRCAEVLFKPSLIGREVQGVHDALFSSIMKCDENVRSKLFSNIVLAGGNTMFPGIADRLTTELTSLAEASMSIGVFAPTDRKDSTWTGASKLAMVPTFSQLLVSRDEYEENGLSFINTKWK
eukprot:augustus_masked-scaffold_8-processed-gene-13.10-mRNA-1 protein AED:0.33 eAED:0.33 QI:0/-1/0/1/-1/1/1/0/378